MIQSTICKTLVCFLAMLMLAGCGIFHVRKMEIEQGNILQSATIKELRTGMTVTQVTDLLGSPALVNIFSPNRIDYVYSFEDGFDKQTKKQLKCVFRNGKLQEIKTS